MPLHVQLLQQDYNTVGAFAACLLLASIALLTLVIKSIVEYQQGRKIRA